MRQDKKGKSFIIKSFPNIRIEAKTEVRDPLKAVFIVISGTFKTEAENKSAEMKKLLRKTSQSIYRALNKDVFIDKFISTNLIPNSFKDTGKCFASFEYTFFLKGKHEFKDVEEQLNTMSEKIYDEVYSEQGDMVFSPYYLAKKK